jgi:fluoride exporter
MRALAIIFFGGGLGAVVRYSLGKWVSTLYDHTFPWGTLVVNVSACFVLGITVGFADSKQLLNASSRLFWTVGFCGGFSTFSTFSHETLSLLQQGLTGQALAYISLSVMLCVGVTWLGIYLAQQV